MYFEEFATPPYAFYIDLHKVGYPFFERSKAIQNRGVESISFPKRMCQNKIYVINTVAHKVAFFYFAKVNKWQITRNAV